ncbi:MAG: hypothetical protein AAGD96_19620 [Chloroflexota bacterium]
MNRKAILFSIFISLGFLLIAATALHPNIAAGQDQPPGETATPTPRPGDYGDAPDSTNNQGVVPNTAYIGVAGNFPTSYQGTASGDPAGPLHTSPNVVFLGDGVSGEVAADFGPDMDGPNNIVNGGLDSANTDGFDDGWLNQDAVFEFCERTTLEVRVTRDSAAGNLDKMYLNVWFDGNRNGEWGDLTSCSSGLGSTIAREWIVINQPIDVGTIPVGSFQDFAVVTGEVPNPFRRGDHWIRFTLSEDPLPKMAKDGRGPSVPNAHEYGETEDYLYSTSTTTADPDNLTITKTINTVDPVIPGSVVSVQIDVKNDEDVPASGLMKDALPAGMEYVGPISFDMLGTVNNPIVNYFAGLDSIYWRGTIMPDSGVRLTFPVEVGYCFGENRTITNTVSFELGGGRLWSDDAALEVDCLDVSPEDITIERRITDYDFVAGDYDKQANPNVYLPKNDVTIETRVTNNTNSVLEIGIEELLEYQRPDLAPSLQASDLERQTQFISANSSVVVEHMISYDELVNDLGVDFHPDGEVVSTVTVCLLDLDDSECSADINKIVDTPWVFEVEMSDLGDAPASRNHADIDMEAYPGVTANFPTVYGPTLAGDPGPIVINAETLHLGRYASFESEADERPDAIWNYHIRSNNIDPAAGLADQEGTSDDGLIPNNLNVANCETTSLNLEIFPTTAAVNYFKNQTASGNAYINIYVDGNRDGDWLDSGVCGASEQVSEHIVINHPINIESLTKDVSFYPVIPTGNVPWKVEDSPFSAPRWMRIMLTDRPVNLNSHGGGDADPYLFGEIEDYLINNDHYPILVEEEFPSDLGISIQEPVLTEPPVGFRAPADDTLDIYRVAVDFANTGGEVVSPTLTLTLTGTEKIEQIVAFNLTNQEKIGDQPWSCSDPSNCEIPLGELGGREEGKAHVYFSVIPEIEDEVIIEASVESPRDAASGLATGAKKALLSFLPAALPSPIVEDIEITEDGESTYTVVISGRTVPNRDVTTRLQNPISQLTGQTQSDDDGLWTVTFEKVEGGRYRAISGLVLNNIIGPPSRPISFVVNDEPIITQIKIVDASDCCIASIGITHDLAFENWANLLHLPPGTYQIDAKITNANDQTVVTLYNII